MDGLQIIVEGILLDAPDNFTAQFTYSVDDIRNFASRNTAFSKTIILPFTAKNKAILGHIYEATSSNYLQGNGAVNYDFNAAKSPRCSIFLDGIQVFKGVLRLLEIVIDEQGVTGSFETCVIGELGGLVSALGEKTLDTLDFSAYNHTFNVATILNSWSKPIGSGYYYPLIDYGYSTDKINYPVETFRPALHIKEYIDKLMKEAGYFYDSAFLDTTYFKKLIMPNNSEAAYREVSTALHVTDVTYSFTDKYPNKKYIQFDSFAPPTNIFSTTNFTDWLWKRAESGKFKLTVKGNWSKSTVFGIEVGYRVGTVGGSFEEVGMGVVGNNTSGAGSYSVSRVVEIPANGYISIWFRSFDAVSNHTFTLTNTDMSLSGMPTVKIPLALGDQVTISDYIPKNFTRLDFLKSIIKMFNLMVWEDSTISGKLYIEPWVNYYRTDLPPVDWSGKLDRSKPYSYKPMGELTSRVFKAAYKADNDYFNSLYKTLYNEVYGEVTYDTLLDQVKDTSKVEVSFSPSPMVGFKGTDIVVPAIYKMSDSGVYSRLAHNPRILFRSAAPITCSTWYIKSSTASDATTAATLTLYGYAGHMDNPNAPVNDLNFGAPLELYFTLLQGSLQNTLFNQFYSFYVGEISDKDSKLMTGYFLLKPSDINTLDFRRIIFIDGALWRLNKIEDYSTDQPEAVKCELLKVIDLVA
jgi:hypothetical protein